MVVGFLESVIFCLFYNISEVGNKTTSFMLLVWAKSIANLSIPRAIPEVGGMVFRDSIISRSMGWQG